MKLLLITLTVYYTVEVSSISLTPLENGITGTGKTTRYWDCCKPSCGWAENLRDKSGTPIRTCKKDGTTTAGTSVQSACAGGESYTCNDQQPRAINSTLALGFVAASFTGGVDTNMCCACILLSFEGELQGKKMLVQVTNTGSDLSSNHFDIAIPGGGVGIFTQGCSSQWGAPSNGWGQQYGGVASADECSQLPDALQTGCKFRFEFLLNVSNPSVKFEQVQCPSEIVDISGCTY
ncbi:hypothetical protein NQ315_004151 [Exocentrus adspersus]|uniref:Cellulase n=1 Tax=Exocentrus adspersus TaxID=1586481 RepID=A0AAV8W752_9CUCU|nr:hypothetical protein NQ315_004151 [Exocentrus adspersus]